MPCCGLVVFRNFHHDSLYLANQYNKHTRDISQTPFAADGRQLAQTSVSEIIDQPAQLIFKADEVKFIASGHKDMDVRMLGKGRPFYMELLNPKQTVVTAKILDGLTKAINQVPQVQQVLTDAVLAKLTPLRKAFDIQQQTLLHVLRRQTQLMRSKHVHGMPITPLANHFMNVMLCTETGTYIKKFIHGDCARSTPNFAQVIALLATLALDVVKVDLQWPPSA
ncbi:hypothetical protein H4R35_003626 [Dimargaris xerosporica]|nr:hypothetical protein H4R35_003626 [Dimargaris xerosporica]